MIILEQGKLMIGPYGLSVFLRTKIPSAAGFQTWIPLILHVVVPRPC